MDKKIWDKFIGWGSGWDLEMERDYKDCDTPIFHLKMYGIWYPEKYELVGRNIDKLMAQAIKDGKANKNVYRMRGV